MPIKWDAQADAKLLVGIFATSAQSIDYPALAEFMGEGVTVNALRLHIRNLKEKAGVLDSPPKGNAAKAAPGDTPPKRKRAPRTRKNKATTKQDPRTLDNEPTPVVKMEGEAIEAAGANLKHIKVINGAEEEAA